MNLCKYSLLLLSISMMVLSTAVVSAVLVTDGQHDVLQTTSPGAYQGGQTYDDIDVDKISYTIDDGTLTLTLVVHGTIREESPYSYYATVQTTDARYSIGLHNGDQLNFIQLTNGSLADEPLLTVNGSTISAVFTTTGDTTVVDVYGHAIHIAAVPEMYQDWLPDSRGPEASGDDDTGDNDTGKDANNKNKRTPGFELLAVVAAVGIVLILLKRRK